jgi:hypothetical protein
MQEQDEDLVQIIRQIREAMGRGATFDPRRLLEKIEILGPSIELSALRANICAEIVDTIGVGWDEWYGRVKAYKEREGHCRVPYSHIENSFKLGIWLANQRANAESIPAVRRQQLDDLGFVWDPFEADWEEGFGHLKAYKEREGHCRVPNGRVENNFKLGTWVANRRAKAQSISAMRRQQLDHLGFIWDPFEADWEAGFNHLKAYREREGDCRVPKDHVENAFALWRWVSKQRSNKKLSEERRRRLQELGFVWDAREASWEEGFSYLKAYKEREGHCRVPDHQEENGFRLGQWVGVQRTYTKSLSQERRRRLDELGFAWDVREADWEQGFNYLKAYKNVKDIAVSL